MQTRRLLMQTRRLHLPLCFSIPAALSYFFFRSLRFLQPFQWKFDPKRPTHTMSAEYMIAVIDAVGVRSGRVDPNLEILAEEG